MNEADIKREIARAWEWRNDEVVAACNALLYLTQAANGEIPHGGIQCPSAPPATTTLTTEISSSEVLDPMTCTTRTAGTMEADPSGTVTSTDTEQRTTNE